MNYNKQLQICNELDDTLINIKRSLTFMMLKSRAIKKHGKISLASGSRNWDEAIQYNFGKWWLTYNVGRDTYMESAK